MDSAPRNGLDEGDDASIVSMRLLLFVLLLLPVLLLELEE